VWTELEGMVPVTALTTSVVLCSVAMAVQVRAAEAWRRWGREEGLCHPRLPLVAEVVVRLVPVLLAAGPGGGRCQDLTVGSGSSFPGTYKDGDDGANWPEHQQQP
jgi:hypothetical protein